MRDPMTIRIICFKDAARRKVFLVDPRSLLFRICRGCGSMPIDDPPGRLRLAVPRWRRSRAGRTTPSAKILWALSQGLGQGMEFHCWDCECQQDEATGERLVVAMLPCGRLDQRAVGCCREGIMRRGWIGSTGLGYGQ